MENPRGLEHRRQRVPGLHHRAFVAAKRELRQPPPESRIEPGLQPDGAVRFDHRLEDSPQGAGLGQRQHMAGTDVTAVAVRTRGAELPLVEQRDCQPSFNR